ncbi:hypothetical protein C2I18_21955 [Paenibacillus sp. PK3_47]|uniref:glycosyltransferase family 8 protein n=1 Tax=Paenibacillus sp. PK3_47 TaxID=2072642 RepID=UPI00201D40BA|nr:glycosyltransferase family 8 protein [Paenibacillus sp. PK3_47]UQZ35960.1 hypothetical protein C2I18_21955 [Paenibacillus sp. PK3_47]
MIQLALALQDKDGRYAEHAGVVLASVFNNTASPVNVHILHDETLTDENKQKLLQLTARYKHTINFYPIVLPEEMLQVMAAVNSINIWTPACMYRLLLPALVEVEKIIYLDCDVLVNMDLAELWNTDLQHHYLGAVWDQGIREVAHVIHDKGLNPDLYFNSGVVLFSLNNIRSHVTWYQETINFLRNYPDSTMPDQDALNAVFGGNYLPLDLHYNFFNLTIPDHNYSSKIVHFAGPVKSWDQESPGWGLYRKYLRLTPWSPFRAIRKRRKRKVRYVNLRLKRIRKLKLRAKRRARAHVIFSKLRVARPGKSRRHHVMKSGKVRLLRPSGIRKLL